MALTNQPYIPFYVDDYLSDEKLNQCEASSEGIYIRIMGIMHKSKEYGNIVLTPFDKVKYKQKASKIKANVEQNENKNLLQVLNIDIDDFYLMVCKIQSMIGRDLIIVSNALTDLLGNDVLQFSNNTLTQKRMKRDGEKSKIRADVGAKGGKKGKNTLNKKEAKEKQISVNGNEIVDGDEIVIPKELKNEEFLSMWKLWKIFRKKNHMFSFLNANSESRKLKELAKKSNNDYKKAIQFLQNGIDNNWKGFYGEGDDKKQPAFTIN